MAARGRATDAVLRLGPAARLEGTLLAPAAGGLVLLAYTAAVVLAL